jgi:integrase
VLLAPKVQQTIVAAHEPFRTLFTVAALAGARIYELCGLTWADIRVDDPDEAEIEFGWQVDRHGNRRPTKTDGSARTVPIPPELAVVLTRHRDAVGETKPDGFVFATEQAGRCSSATSRAPCARRRGAQSTATDGPSIRSSTRRTTWDSQCRSHLASFRRCTRFDTPSPLARASGRRERLDEVAFLLGHRDGTVTRTVYVREVADGRRRAMRRSRMAAEFAGALRAALDSPPD